MEIQADLSISDELLNGKNEKVSRKVLEQFSLEGYKTGKLSYKQIGNLLGFSSRFEVDDFLHRNQAFDYTVEDLKDDLKTLEDLDLK
jgi:hypothetical protein